MTAAYAVPADPKRELQSIVFHNRYDRADFDVAAVTLNTGRATVIPKAVREPEPYRVAQVVRPQDIPPAPTTRNSQELVVTRDGEVGLDHSQGFAIRSLSTAGRRKRRLRWTRVRDWRSRSRGSC